LAFDRLGNLARLREELAVLQLALDEQTSRVVQCRDEVVDAYTSGAADDVRTQRRRRLVFESHFLVVAIRNAVTNAIAVHRVTGDHRLHRATELFHRAFPDTKDARDVLAHLDEYLVGEGRMQRIYFMDPAGMTRAFSDRKGEVYFLYAWLEVPLISTGYAAMTLAETALDVAEDVHERWSTR
jgi:hypothetical protein